jgi:hypothetical protein
MKPLAAAPAGAIVSLRPRCLRPPTWHAARQQQQTQQNQWFGLLALRLLLLMALQPQRRPNPMTHTQSAIEQNQIQKSLVPMLRTWTQSIGWTVLLSAALAVLFAMLCDGCSGMH